ncbi:MAG: site-specific integrase [Ideonella sp.]|nr:site-specific integrase [Ideonella sp.]
MKQAKTLTPQELRQALGQTALSRHAARDKAMLLLTHLAGMRVGEVAALHVGDVLDADGNVKGELRLGAHQTKGNVGRVVFINDRLQKELAVYARTLRSRDATSPFFMTQKRTRFSANTLTQHFVALYRKAGLEGATSHSGRRTFITNLAAQGVSVRVLAALAGHRSIQTTQRYIDVNDNMLRRAVELV